MSGDPTPEAPPPDTEAPELTVTPDMEVVARRWSGGQRRKRDYSDAGDGGPVLPPAP